MKIPLLNFLRDKTLVPSPFTVLAVGSDFVRALVIEVGKEESEEVETLPIHVVGVGTVAQDLSDSRMGVVSDIKAVAQNIRRVGDEVSFSDSGVPKDVVLGVSGMMVEGFTTRARLDRKHPDRPVSEKELLRITAKVRKAAYEEVVQEIAEIRGQYNPNLKVINSEITGIDVDSFPVSEPFGFKGERLEISFFTAVVIEKYLDALETAVRSAGLKSRQVFSSNYAVLKALLANREASEFDGVLINVGGETTDVSIVFGGGIVSSETLSVGGRDFTRALSRARNISFSDAANLKDRYIQGECSLDEETALREVFAPVFETWSLGLREGFLGMNDVEEFPGRIYVYGTDSQLLGIKESLESSSFAGELPFVGGVTVERISLEDFDFFVDQTDELNVSVGWVMPISVAYLWASGQYE